jgi:hypothetical protein
MPLFVFAFWVVEHLNIFKHVLPCGFACLIGFPSNTFTFKQVKESLSHSVIIAIPTAAHAGIQIVLAEKHLPLTTGDLGTLIRVDHDTVFGFATSDGGEQRL